MITCDRFEHDYEAWRKEELTAEDSDALQWHFDTCPGCQRFAENFSILRQRLLSMPQCEPSIRFKYQLNRKINDINAGVEKGRSLSRLFPRWAAIGAGLVTGFALGLVVIIQNVDNETTDTQMFAGKPEIESREQLVSNIDSDSTEINSDSIDVPVSNYRLDRYSQAVSSEY